MDFKKLLMLAVISSGIIMGLSFALINLVSDYSLQLAQIDGQAITASESSDGESQAQEASNQNTEQNYETTLSSVLSPQETKEVQTMLTELGFGKASLAESLTAFREENLIVSYQCLLDNAVLESIISQLSLQRAQAFGSLQ
ncbi:MAG: hypothetical protein GXY50_01910 [Syntrophomonadaceae bacterium]|nr:hypothetical protein [Syntrophomonadaceae bacterium]